MKDVNVRGLVPTNVGRISDRMGGRAFGVGLFPLQVLERYGSPRGGSVPEHEQSCFRASKISKATALSGERETLCWISSGRRGGDVAAFADSL
jgi:hypothetical protein